MKITKITTSILKAPLKTPFVTSLRRVDMLEDVVVMIECDSGDVGFGEGAPTPAITGETKESIVATVEKISSSIVGMELEDFDSILKKVHDLILKNTTAKSAVEIALYDLKAKSEKLPLYRMLGGTQKDFRTDITISLGETDTMVQDSLSAVSLGYSTLKIKIGDTPKKDFERIIEIKNAVPEGVNLRLDANQGWLPEESVSLLLALEKRGLVAEFIEQPVAANDLNGLKYIKERVQTPILADESVFSVSDARTLLEMKAVDYINIKLAKTAGITQALELADLCHVFETKCMIGCMLEGPISVAAGVHLASAKADIITMLDLDAVALLASHPVETSISFNESQIVLSDAFGLGIEGVKPTW